jgi:Flp pilus assembly protein CpaB
MPRLRTHPLRAAAVAARRLLARRPWLYWAAVVAVAAATSAAVRSHAAGIDRAIAEWGATRPVLVTRVALSPGDPVVGDWREYPESLIPDTALTPADGQRLARHHLDPGEIITVGDTVGGGPLARLPDGWLAVAVIESPPSGAGPGDRVQLASDGITLAGEAIVIGTAADATLIGVPSEIAPLVPLAAQQGTLAVLRLP